MYRFALVFAIFFVLLTSCSEQSSEMGRNEILATLHAQQDAWNKGDIDGFMSGYWNNDSLMFISGDKVSYGWQQVTDNYKAKYTSKEVMGKLTFDVIKLEQMSSTDYVMLGSWRLDREIAGETMDISGKFSLVWKKIDGNWVIVIDHTS